jgi:hypothetical protein
MKANCVVCAINQMHKDLLEAINANQRKEDESPKKGVRKQEGRKRVLRDGNAKKEKA